MIQVSGGSASDDHALDPIAMADPRPLRLLYFAWLRERIGTAEEEVAPPQGTATVAALVAWLRTRGPGYEAAFGTAAPVRCAINQDFAQPDSAIAPGDEVAFFPPVTGG